MLAKTPGRCHLATAEREMFRAQNKGALCSDCTYLSGTVGPSVMQGKSCMTCPTNRYESNPMDLSPDNSTTC